MLIETLLHDLPDGWRVSDVYVGLNWTLVLANAPDGRQGAGVASTPKQIAPDARFQIGHYRPDEDARGIAGLLRSDDLTAAAVGLAAINALNPLDESSITTADAADWLAARAVDRRVAIFGRFPFIDDEIRPNARQVWVFEQTPQAGELDLSQAAQVLPQAEIVAITSSSVINHTVDQLLPHMAAGSIVMLMGPSTPLAPKLFALGITALFGVRVVDVGQVIASVIAGEDFQKMHGLQRVAVFKPTG